MALIDELLIYYKINPILSLKDKFILKTLLDERQKMHCTPQTK